MKSEHKKGATISRVHIVHVSRDYHLLEPARYPEAIRRQEKYLELIRERLPSAQVTIIIVAKGATSRREGEIGFDGLDAGSFLKYPRLGSRLILLHRNSPIALITTQTIWGEGLIAALVARAYGLPIIGQLHTDPFVMHGIKGLTLRAIIKVTARLFSRIRTVSPALRDQLSRFYPVNRIDVSPVASFLELLPVMDEPATKDNFTEKLILFVGRFTSEKRLDRWLRVAAEVHRQVPEARFCLVGEGNLRQKVVDWIRELNLESIVEIQPWCHSDVLAKIYKRASTLLLSSDQEGFGRVIIEAFMNGVPVVAPDYKTISDRVRDGETGYTYPKDDIQMAAARIISIISDPKHLAFLRDNARRAATEFNPETLAARWCEIMVRSINVSN